VAGFLLVTDPSNYNNNMKLKFIEIENQSAHIIFLHR
jgi:hypothetical protein